MTALSLEAIVAAVAGRRFGPISGTLAPGDRLALVGPSGTGKTTLLQAIAGLHPIASGTLRLDTEEATGWAPERRRLAYLHQTPRLFPHLDVLGNVALARRVAGDPTAVAAARRWLEAVHLDARATDGIGGLSGGEQQRVALARALASAPRALLLDEPFSALDPALRRGIRAMVDEVLHDDGPAAILVTHDLDEAAAFASAVVALLPDGTVWSGPVATLIHTPPTTALARLVGLENLIPPPVLGVGVPAGTVLVGVRAAAVAISPDPAGAWRAVRCQPTELGYRCELESPGGRLMGLASTALAPGARGRVTVDPTRLVAFGADGTRLPPD